jgi:predicted amidohydrolase YtcJ
MSLLALIPLFFACSQGNAPDRIFHGGPILTVDHNDQVVEAIAIKDGVITYVGPSSSILQRAGSSTEIIDLDGKTLIPGFIAAHEHPTLTAVFSSTVDVSGFSFDSSKAMWQHLKQKIEQAESGEWIFASGLDPVLMPDLLSPDIAFLDKLAPNNPLFIISQTMHSFWANSKAFEAHGITKLTSDPGKGSYYGKGEDGELNGFISESAAAQPFMDPLKSPFGMLGKYQDTLQSLVESGFTSVASLGYNMPPLFAKYASSNNFSPRIRQFFYLHKDELEYLPDTPDNGDDYFKIMGVKLWHDGSPYTGTMAITAPYLHNSLTEKMGIDVGHKGEPRISEQEFHEQLDRFDSENWQVAVHSQGDQSNSELLALFKQSFTKPNNQKNIQSRRHRVEHCLLIPKSALHEFKALGLTPSFHVNHLYYYGDALAESIIGPSRAETILPIKTAIELGLHPTLHADSPMFPADPFSLMKTAITRKTKSGKYLGLEQAISPQKALRTMTINAAWQLNMETKIGSIEVGKLADLTLISHNLYQLPTERWSEIKVQGVWLAGERKL